MPVKSRLQISSTRGWRGTQEALLEASEMNENRHGDRERKTLLALIEKGVSIQQGREELTWSRCQYANTSKSLTIKVADNGHRRIEDAIVNTYSTLWILEENPTGSHAQIKNTTPEHIGPSSRRRRGT